MKKRALLSSSLVIIAAILILQRMDPPLPSPSTGSEDTTYEKLAARAKASGLPIPPREGIELQRPRARKGFEVAEWHYTKMNFPYGPRLPRAIVEQMLDGKKLRPDEDDYGPFKASEPWEFIGPSGMDVRGSSRKDSGRITDLEWRADSGLRVATANGGLWRYNILGIPVPIADELDVLCIGSFDTHPTNSDEILVGTGDPVGATGAGLYRTVNGGASWFRFSGDPAVDSYYDLRYSPWSADEIHAATNKGHFRFDTGSGWNSIKLGTACSSIAFNPSTAGYMLGGFWSDGIYWTPDSGDTWNKSDISAIVADSMVRRVSVTICNDQPANAWALVSRPATGSEKRDQLGWILRSTDGGVSWNDMGLPDGFATDQGGYNHVIAVHPKDPNTAIVGGVQLWRTTNNGADWSQLSGVHADNHVIEWTLTGNNVYNGSDGGLYESTDAGATWASPNNRLPVTQFYSVDVCQGDPTMVTGGAQDNGSAHTLNLVDWEEHLGGDGGAVAIDPESCNFSLATTGLWSGNVPDFRPQRSSNTFGSWDVIDNGIDNDDEEWTPWIRAPAQSDYYYVHDENDIYRTVNDGDDWVKISGVGILKLEVLTAERTNWGALYACTTDEDFGGTDRMFVYRDGVWAGGDDPIFPDPGLIRKVTPHPKLLGTAYAIVSDATSMGPGGSVFMTEDWGATWSDVSILLTNVIPVDVVAHPDDPNQIYVGTELGVVWTPNRGTDWLDWDLGMPAGTQFTEFVTTPTGTGTPGEYWIYASTFGRGMWRRKITAAAPGNPDTALSTVETEGGQLYCRPDGSGETLSSKGATVRVQIVDSNRVPVPGIDASRITLSASASSSLEFCSPVTADAPTDAAGWTSFSGALPAGAQGGLLQVRIDGAPVEDTATVSIRTPDINGDLRVDLCDLEMFSLDRNSDYAFRSDLNWDGANDIADAVLLDAGMDDGAHCPSISPTLESPEGELGLWFDMAGTQFGQLAQQGDYVDLYIVARNFTNSIRAIEFQIPALAHPAVDVTFRNLNYPEASYQSLTAPHEFQIAFGNPAPFDVDMELVLGTIRIQLLDDVRNLRFCIEPLDSSSFGAPGAAGWINGFTPCSLTPFAETSCAEINPFPGDVWAGMEHDLLGPAELVPLGDHLALQGLDSPVSGGVQIHFGGRYPGSTKLAETAPLDGAGIFFASSLPSPNLQDGATFDLSFDGPGGTPVVTMNAVVSNGMWSASADMSAIGSPSLRVTLRNGGQDVLFAEPFDGTWLSDDILPKVAAALKEGDALILYQEWDQPITLIIGGNAHMGDELKIETDAGFVAPGGLVARAVLTGSLLPTIVMENEAIQRNDNIYAAIDNVYLKSESNRLRFMLLEAGMPGLAVMEAYGDQRVDVYSQPPAPHESDARLVMQFEGRDESQLPPMTLELRNGPIVLLSSDMSQVGAQGWAARGYAGGAQQWEFTGNGFDIGEASAWPTHAVMTDEGIQMDWGSAVTITELMPKSGSIGKMLDPIDMLVLAPLQPALPLPTGVIVVNSFFDINWDVTFEPTGTPTPPIRGFDTALHPNVPNPFNPSTELRFSLARAGQVSLDIYDQRGRVVRRLLSEHRPVGEGSVTWNGRDASGAPVASGVYHVMLRAEGVSSSRKITLVK